MGTFISDGGSVLPGLKSDTRPASIPPTSEEWSAVDANKLRSALLDVRSAALGWTTGFVSPGTALVTATGTTTARALMDRFGEVFNVLDFGADSTGTYDVQAAFQACADAAAASAAASVAIIIPHGTYLMQASSPTVSAPYVGMRITRDNVAVIGHGYPVINMTGVTKAYIDAQTDYLSSARDFFSAITFRRVTGCSISGIKFTGEWDGTGFFVYTSPRAKGASFIGTTDCSAWDLWGDGLMGNLVNFTPADKDYDPPGEASHRYVYGYSIQNCHANKCLEVGLSLMGNTFRGVISGNTARYCGSAGIETATQQVSVNGNTCEYNKKVGIGFSGPRASISNNVVCYNGGAETAAYGVGIVASGSYLTPGESIISGNLVTQNDGFGIQLYPGTSKILIQGNVLSENGLDGTYTYAIYGVGTVARRISDILVANNYAYDSNANMDGLVTFEYADDCLVTGNFVRLDPGKTSSMSFQTNSTNCIAYGNKVNRPISISSGSTGSLRFVNIGDGSNRIFSNNSIVGMESGFLMGSAVVTYGTTCNIDCTKGNHFSIEATNGTGFLIANPSGAGNGQVITITVRNNSGGALGTITWGSQYNLATFTAPTDAHQITISFKYDASGPKWDEIGRMPGEAPI